MDIESLNYTLKEAALRYGRKSEKKFSREIDLGFLRPPMQPLKPGKKPRKLFPKASFDRWIVERAEPMEIDVRRLRRAG